METLPTLSSSNMDDTKSSVKSICVLCAANLGSDLKYIEMAKRVAQVFHTHNWTLVYGASSQGLMGILARELVQLGGDVRGVKPKPYLKYDPTGDLPDFGHNELVPDLDTQKVRMLELSDAFVFLPGGFCTLEELGAFRMWSKLGIHKLPIILFNFEGYFTHLLKWFEVGEKEGFISAVAFRVIERLEDLEDALANYNFITSETFDTGGLPPMALVPA